MSYDHALNMKKLFDSKVSVPTHINILLENKIVTFIASFGSRYYKALQILGKWYKKYFHKLSVSHSTWYITVEASFSDLMRLFLLDVWNEAWWSKQKIRRVFLLLKYNSCNYLAYKWKWLSKDQINSFSEKYEYLVPYFTEESFKTVFFDLPMEWWPEENKRVIKLYKGLENDFKVKQLMITHYRFECAIFDMISYGSSYSLWLVYKKGLVDSIFFSNKHNLAYHLSGLVNVELYRLNPILLRLALSGSFEKGFLKNIWSIHDVDIEDSQSRLLIKNNYYKELSTEYSSIFDKLESMDSNSYEYANLEKQLSLLENSLSKIMNEIILEDYHMYDYLASDDNLIDSKKIQSPSLNLEVLQEHMFDIVSGMFSAEIEQWKIKSVQVYKKDYKNMPKDIRVKYPYAEVWQQIYWGKHKFSTVRYKKDIE